MLEVDFGSQLEYPLPEATCDLSHASTASTGGGNGAARVWIVKVRCVAEVQRLRPDPQFEAFRELEGAEEAEVKLRQARSSQP